MHAIFALKQGSPPVLQPDACCHFAACHHPLRANLTKKGTNPTNYFEILQLNVSKNGPAPLLQLRDLNRLRLSSLKSPKKTVPARFRFQDHLKACSTMLPAHSSRTPCFPDHFVPWPQLHFTPSSALLSFCITWDLTSIACIVSRRMSSSASRSCLCQLSENETGREFNFGQGATEAPLSLCWPRDCSVWEGRNCSHLLASHSCSEVVFSLPLSSSMGIHQKNTQSRSPQTKERAELFLQQLSIAQS